jgi:hypothetical protein
MRSVRPSRQYRLALWGFGVVATTLLSVAMAWLGLLFLGLSAMCVDAGVDARAYGCIAGAYVVVGCCWLTVPLPVVFGWWGGRASTSRVLAKRLGVCALGYLVPVLVVFLSSAG